MSKFLLGLIISLVMGLTMYLASLNLYYAIGTFVVYFLYFILIFNKTIKKFQIKSNRIHHSYHFINSFLITLSVKDSLDEAYKSAIQGVSGELKDITDELNNMDVTERLNYLRRYFNIAIYKMFLDVLKLYLEQGGSILALADSIILETSRIEETLNKSNASSKRVMFEFVVLWVMAVAVLLFMRFSITDFYLKMLNNTLFIVLLFAFFLLVLVSIHIFTSRYTNIYIKEDKVE